MSASVPLAPPETISILAAPAAAALGIGNAFRPADVPIDLLKGNLVTLVRGFSSVLADLPETGGFDCSELTLTANITAEGQVQLVGVVQAGGQLQGGVTLTFKRRDR